MTQTNKLSVGYGDLINTGFELLIFLGHELTEDGDDRVFLFGNQGTFTWRFRDDPNLGKSWTILSRYSEAIG